MTVRDIIYANARLKELRDLKALVTCAVPTNRKAIELGVCSFCDASFNISAC